MIPVSSEPQKISLHKNSFKEKPNSIITEEAEVRSQIIDEPEAERILPRQPSENAPELEEVS